MCLNQELPPFDKGWCYKFFLCGTIYSLNSKQETLKEFNFCDKGSRYNFFNVNVDIS